MTEQKGYTKEDLRGMLNDVVNVLDLSEAMEEKHGPLGTAPAELVRLVLEQKDLEIRMLKNGFKSIDTDKSNVDGACPEHGELCRGADCCCADKHIPSPVVLDGEMPEWAAAAIEKLRSPFTVAIEDAPNATISWKEARRLSLYLADRVEQLEKQLTNALAPATPIGRDMPEWLTLDIQKARRELEDPFSEKSYQAAVADLADQLEARDKEILSDRELVAKVHAQNVHFESAASEKDREIRVLKGATESWEGVCNELKSQLASAQEDSKRLDKAERILREGYSISILNIAMTNLRGLLDSVDVAAMQSSAEKDNG